MANSFDPELVKEFLVEAEETLSSFSNNLLELEESPGNESLIQSLFRSAHGIKGMSGMFGFTKISELTHEMENVLDQVRKGNLRVNREIVDALLKGYDLTRALMDEIRGQEDRGLDTKETLLVIQGVLKEKEEVIPIITLDLDKVHPELRALIQQPFQVDELKKAVFHDEKIYEIQLSLIDSLMREDVNIITIFKLIEATGNLIVSTSIQLDVPSLEDFDPEKCFFKIHFLITTSIPAKKIENLLADIVHKVVLIEITSLGSTEKKDLPLGEILKSTGKISDEDIETALEEQRPKKLGEVLVNEGKISEEELNRALEKQKAQGKGVIGQTLRVDQDKIDLFMNLIGEQTIITNTISKIAKRLKGLGDTKLEKEIAELYNSSISGERIIEELQESVLKIRMVPMKTIFQNFPRIIRDISKKRGKDIEFRVAGESIEIDKNIIDKINDPLVHMVRNSADHGIETPDIREKAGKKRTGLVSLSARIEDKFVILEIEDDGAGMNIPRIKEKALEKGIVTAADLENMDTKKIVLLTFAPGFSTAEQVTDISGRGVGMDIVVTALRELNGTIDVETTQGQGTKMILSIPVNLGILEKMLLKALIVDVSGDLFAIPIDSVVETLNIRKDEISNIRNREAIYLRGDVMGIVNLENIIMSKKRGNGSREKTGKKFTSVVIIADGNKRVGIVVDRLLGQQSIVIKQLQELLTGIEEIKGATILGDGRVILVLNSKMVLRKAAV